MGASSGENGAATRHDRVPAADPQTYARSRLSNGADLFLAAVDGRSREARRYRDIFAGLVQHLGGQDHAGEARLHLAKRTAALVTWCEVIEAKLAAGEQLDVATYTTAVNTLRRLLLDLGLDPTQRDVTPSLSEYLAHRQSEASA